MRAAAARIALHDGPMLAFIETGAGKTEAALILAQRMLTPGKARGLFFALPTMATADAMFARARQVIRRLFTAPPSLTLAHGRAGLSAEFLDVRAQGAASDDAICRDWIGDNRRRALLADVGIGTVDQALLAVPPTRFATLWRTADELFRRGQIVAPSGLRALIEAVHGPDPVAVPPALQQAEEDQQGKGYAAAGLGRQNVIKIDLDYREGGGVELTAVNSGPGQKLTAVNFPRPRRRC